MNAIHSTPSRPGSARIPPKTVNLRRANFWATDIPDYTFIHLVGMKLGFPVQTICTAQLLHTKYTRRHFESTGYTRTEVNITCLFVACKAEETIKKLRDIVLAAYIIIYPTGDYLSVSDNDIEYLRRQVIMCEASLLEILHFCFEFPHPHRYLVKFARCLDVDKDIAGKAWKMTTECFQTTLPLRFPPHTVALGALYLASKLAHAPLEPPAITTTDGDLTPDHSPWYVKLGARPEDVDEFSHHMIDFYIASSRKPVTPTVATHSEVPN
ncbi:RNA polymerase II C-terminal domain kinase beta subunit [Tieghemiomyces parasiticus]|uniref:RNA polymerase II C-terminal domain kinase beta subunit n=1 Tax=Tieghemiomyces parasiticus TaxID=78921 RepID=A0A9W8DJP7_9FUNG|nr:RNA polymerase II C-terminal domain kinase beta subunit [Tieghemiomyces parasiticus]